jgi:hypothetical protein
MVPRKPERSLSRGKITKELLLKQSPSLVEDDGSVNISGIDGESKCCSNNIKT